jgi:hypothetical protein
LNIADAVGERLGVAQHRDRRAIVRGVALALVVVVLCIVRRPPSSSAAGREVAAEKRTVES